MPAEVVWLPMKGSDDRTAARDMSSELPGVPQFWDGDRALGKAVARSLGAPDWTAWDVYLFYGPDATWSGDDPPRPDKALAQVAGVVVGLPGTLPESGDSSRLPDKLRGKVVVVGEQDHLATLLSQVSHR